MAREIKKIIEKWFKSRPIDLRNKKFVLVEKSDISELVKEVEDFLDN